MTKLCTMCLITKDVTEFYPKLARCKVCHCADRIKRYRTQPDKERAWSRRWQTANPERFKAVRQAYIQTSAYKEKNRARSRLHYSKQSLEEREKSNARSRLRYRKQSLEEREKWKAYQRARYAIRKIKKEFDV